MDFNKRLLSVAISSILLSACGGSGGSSSSGDEEVVVPPAGPEVTTPDPVLPPPLPVNPTLTSEQKLALGQAYVPTLLGNLKSISQGADAFMLSSGNAEASLLPAGAEFFEYIGSFSSHIYESRKQYFNNELDEGIEYPLPTRIRHHYQDYIVGGHYEVSIGNDEQPILSYEVTLTNENRPEDPEQKISFDISLLDGPTSDYGKGSWLHQVKLDGFLDKGDDYQVTIQNLILKIIVDINDEAKLAAAAWDKYTATASYQLELNAEKITVVANGIRTSGKMDLIGIFPIVESNSGYGYGSTGDGGGYYREYTAFNRYIYELVPLASEWGSYFNVKDFTITDLLSERVEGSKQLIAQDFIQLADKNPETFSTVYGGKVTNQKIADYAFSEDDKKVTFNGQVSSVTFTLINESNKSYILCEGDKSNFLLPIESSFVVRNSMVSYSTLGLPWWRESGCSDEKILLEKAYSSIKEFIFDDNFSFRAADIQDDFPKLFDVLEVASAEQIPESGSIIITDGYDSNSGIDGIHNPWLFDFSSQGKAPDSNGNFLNYDLNWSHQGLFDYAGNVTIDVLGETIELDLTHKDGAVAIHGAVVIDRQAIEVEGTSQVEINIDVSNLVHQVLNNETASYINESIGNIQLDGENVAQLNVISGNFSNDANAEDYTLTLPNPLLCNALMPMLYGFCLRMEPQTFALAIQYSDGTALTEIDGLIDNVENLVYEESCPEDQVIEGGCNIEPLKTFHSVSGVIKAAQLFDALK